MTLDQFQLDTLDFLDDAKGRAVLADPMGARKTGTTLTWLSHTPCGKTLVVAPSAVHGHWEREAARFYPEADVLRGNTKARRHRAIADAGLYDTVPVVYITTYDSMKADQDLLLATFDTVVYDEAHRLKGRTTQVAKASNAFAKACEFVLLLTGTPVINRADELWQYLNMLAPKEYRSFWKWVDYYFEVTYAYYQGRMGPQTKVIGKVKKEREQELRDEIAPYFLQRDIADLYPGQAWVAEPDHVALNVKLSPPERKVYENLVKHSWAIFTTGEEVTASNAAVLNTRFEQITSDWGTLDDQLGLGSKSKAAVELVTDLVERGEKVVLFAKFQRTVDRIADALVGKHIAAAVYHGGVREDERDARAQAFAAGEYQVLVGTLGSLSEGVDGLQFASSTVVMVDRHPTYAKNDQAIGRVRRSGQLHAVTVYHVYAEDTIDQTVVQACLDKRNVIQVLRDKPLIDAIYGK